MRAGMLCRLWACALIACAFGLGAVPAQAQSVAERALRAPVLTIEVERVFLESAAGAELDKILNDERVALAAENRNFEAELRAEELSLTAMRQELSPEEFRALANAFDEKVQQIREEQDTKEQDLTRRAEDERRRLLVELQPVLAQIMIETGAAVILERRNVFLSFDTVDITDLAIDRINARLSAPEDGQ